MKYNILNCTACHKHNDIFVVLILFGLRRNVIISSLSSPGVDYITNIKALMSADLFKILSYRNGNALFSLQMKILFHSSFLILKMFL